MANGPGPPSGLPKRLSRHSSTRLVVKRPADAYGPDDGSTGWSRRRFALLAVGVAVLLVLVVVAATAFVVPLDTGGHADPWYAFVDVEEEYDGNASELRLAYESGEPVDVEQLTVTVNDTETEAWTATSERLEPGEDAVVVRDVDPGATVGLYWTHPERGDENSLYRTTVTERRRPPRDDL